MRRRSPENQSNFDFEPSASDNIVKSQEWKKAKETVDANAAIGKAEDEMRTKVYSLLSDEEREEFYKLKTPTEKRQYIVRKYSKYFTNI